MLIPVTWLPLPPSPLRRWLKNATEPQDAYVGRHRATPSHADDDTHELAAVR